MSLFCKMLAKMKARSVSESGGAGDEPGPLEDAPALSTAGSPSELTSSSSSQPVFPGTMDCPPPSSTEAAQSEEAGSEITKIPLSVIGEEDKIPIGNTPPGPVRPMERQQLRPWLIEQINRADIKGLEWIDQNLKVFKIPWKHRSRCGWKQEADACLFKRWAVHTGRFVEGKDKADPRRWKANFRCAVNSRPDIEEVKAMTRKTGTDAYRVYRFLPESEGKLVKNLKNKFEKETRRSTKEYLSYVLHQHQQIRQEEPIDLSVPETGTSKRDKKSLEAARALADLSKPFNKDEEKEMSESATSETRSSPVTPAQRKQLESRFTDEEGFVWEVLRVKSEPVMEEQGSVSSDGDETVESNLSAPSESENSCNNPPSTPNSTNYVHAGLLSGGGLQPNVNDGDSASAAATDASNEIIITSITPMFSSAAQTVTSASSSLASRHLTMKRALEQEPKTSLAGDGKKLEPGKTDGKEQCEPPEKSPRVEEESSAGSVAYISSDGNANSASKALLAAAAKHRMPMMMMKEGQSRTALPATVLGIKPTGGSNLPVTSGGSSQDTEASSFYRYNPMYGGETSTESETSRFYRYNPMYGDEKGVEGQRPNVPVSKEAREKDQPAQMQTGQEHGECAQNLHGLGSLVKKTNVSGAEATSPGVLVTPIILQQGNGMNEATPAKSVIVTTQGPHPVLTNVQKGMPVAGNRRVMPNNVTVRTLLAASRAASGKPDPLEKVVTQNVKEILHNPPTTANVFQGIGGTLPSPVPREPARLKSVIPLVSLASLPSSSRPMSTPPTQSGVGMTYSLVPENPVYLTNIASIIENTKKDLKQTEEQIGERFNNMEENIQKAVLEAYRSHLPDLVAQTVKEIMETRIEPLRREVAVEMERLKQQVAQLEQVQQATNSCAATTPTTKPAFFIPKPSTEILSQLQANTTTVLSSTTDELNNPATIYRQGQLAGLSQRQAVFVPTVSKGPQITIKSLPGGVDKGIAELPSSVLQLSAQNLQSKAIASKPIASISLASLQMAQPARPGSQTEKNFSVVTESAQSGIMLAQGKYNPKVASQLLQLASQVANRQGSHPCSSAVESIPVPRLDDFEHAMSCTLVPAITSTIMSTTMTESVAVSETTSVVATPQNSTLSVPNAPPSSSGMSVEISVPVLTVGLQISGKT